MKKFKKLFGMFTALLIILGGVNLISCSDSDDDENEPEYSISIADSDKEITLAPGGSQTISVTTNGKMVTPTSSDSNVATATLDNSKKTITITAASGITETKTAEITVKLSDDSSKSVTIKVTVNPEIKDTYEITLSLSDELAEVASTISVYAEGKEDEETTAALYQTVEATYTAGATTATAKLDKSKANSYKDFNNIVVTIKDKNGNEVKTVATPNWFDYSKAETTTIALTKYVSSTNTISFSFSNLSVKAGTLTYGSSDSDETALTTVDLTVDSENSSATAEISSNYCNTSGWYYISKITLYSNAEKTTEITDTEISCSDSKTNSWHDFKTTNLTITVSQAVSEKTFKIVFDGFTIAGGSVEGLKYSNTWANSSSEWVEANITTPTVTVATDGTYATFTVAASTLTSTAEFYIDWTAVSIKDSNGNTVKVSGLTDANQWYSFAKTDSLTITATKASTETTTALITSLTEDTGSASYSATGKDIYQLLVAYDTIKDYTSVTITATDAAKGNEDSSKYLYFSLGTASGTYKASLSGSDTTYSATITPSDYSSAGVWIASGENNTATITITGSTESASSGDVSEDDSGTTTTKLLSSETVTIATEGTYQLAVSYDLIKDYSKVYITLANITNWGSGTEGYKTTLGTGASTWKADLGWVDSGKFTDSNVSGSTGGYFAEITPSDYSSGVYITGKAGLAGTLYVTGITSSSE